MKNVLNINVPIIVLIILMGLMTTQIIAQEADITIDNASVLGVKIASSGSNGIQINSAGIDGLQIQSAGRDGLRVSSAQEWGVNVAGTIGGGFFSGNNNTYDLHLGGDGWVRSDGHFTITLDQDGTTNDGLFIVQDNTFNTALWVYEHGTGGVTGLWQTSGGTYKIDHPLDPANKYLYHSFVESPEMMNVYNGNVVLDAAGEAIVEMADWFEALNKTFRYQLTPIGAPGPNLYVSQEINGNTFRIAGGTPGMKVSWQVTGVRQDPFASENRVQVEVEKESFNKGKYLHPRAWEKVKGVTGLESVTLKDNHAVPGTVTKR